MRQFLLLVLLLISTQGVLSAQFTFRGVVKDAASGAPLPFVNGQLTGTARGFTTDARGRYRFTGPAAVDTVAFSFVGYRPARYALRAGAAQEWKLSSGVAAISEFVVEGGRTARRLVRRAVERIPDNYTPYPEVLSGTALEVVYRDSTRRERFYRMESLVDAQKTGYRNGGGAGTVTIRGVELMRDSIYSEIKGYSVGVIHDVHDADLVKQRAGPLARAKGNGGTFTYSSDSSRIRTPQRRVDYAYGDITGYLWIDTISYAVTETYWKEAGVGALDKLFGVEMEQYETWVTYAAAADGYYRLASVHSEAQFSMPRQSLFLLSDFVVDEAVRATAGTQLDGLITPSDPYQLMVGAAQREGVPLDSINGAELYRALPLKLRHNLFSFSGAELRVSTGISSMTAFEASLPGIGLGTSPTARTVPHIYFTFPIQIQLNRSTKIAYEGSRAFGRNEFQQYALGVSKQFRMDKKNRYVGTVAGMLGYRRIEYNLLRRRRLGEAVELDGETFDAPALSAAAAERSGFAALRFTLGIPLSKKYRLGVGAAMQYDAWRSTGIYLEERGGGIFKRRNKHFFPGGIDLPADEPLFRQPLTVFVSLLIK